jgi:hypothetical protein
LDIEYQLYICSFAQITFGETFVPFDTTFEFEAQEFILKLIVFDQGVPIDSLEKFFISQIGIGIEDLTPKKGIPNSQHLLSCYPNPFNPYLTIDFITPPNDFVQISIFNNLGQELKTLFAGKILVGIGKVHWDASKYSSGNYYVLLRSKDYIYTKKVIHIK